MVTPTKTKIKPDSKSTPKKDITNREYYDGRDAELENASVESLSSTNSYVEVEMPTPKGKQKQDTTTSSGEDVADSFITVKSSHAGKEGGGQSKGVRKKKGGSGGGDGGLGEDMGEEGVENGGRERRG